MEKNETPLVTPRKAFIGTLATGAATLGLASLASCVEKVKEEKQEEKKEDALTNDADKWFAGIKGKHRVVYDSPGPKGMLTFAWPKVFLLTNEQTGSPKEECGVVVILRHDSFAFAFQSGLWEKYKLGEMCKVDDSKTKKPAIRNEYWQPKEGDFSVPGIGAIKIGINELQEDGVMFCVCGMAIKVHVAVLADAMEIDAAEIQKDFDAALLPGIQIVPSGVWAVGRAHEHGCAYIYAG